jgi:hypothetical protein
LLNIWYRWLLEYYHMGLGVFGLLLLLLQHGGNKENSHHDSRHEDGR